jgi:hypothetical protein
MSVLHLEIRHAFVRQVIQNLVVFAGILFAHQWRSSSAIIRSLAAFVLLSLCSYLVVMIVFNVKLKDQESNQDLRQLTWRSIVIPLSLIGVVILISSKISILFCAVIAVYSVIALIRDIWIHQEIILDVIILAVEFSLKAVSGVVILEEGVLSPWLVTCTFLLALVVALGKRKNELRVDRENSEATRAGITGYSEKLLNQMMAVVTSSTFLTYTLYTIAPRTKAVFGHTYLLYTVPFVLYGILRYLYVVQCKDMTAGSEIAVLKDIPTLVTILLWLISVISILQIG